MRAKRLNLSRDIRYFKGKKFAIRGGGHLKTPDMWCTPPPLRTNVRGLGTRNTHCVRVVNTVYLTEFTSMVSRQEKCVLWPCVVSSSTCHDCRVMPPNRESCIMTTLLLLYIWQNWTLVSPGKRNMYYDHVVNTVYLTELNTSVSRQEKHILWPCC